MKKVLSLLLALCMTTGLLAGCAKTQPASNPAQSDAPAADAAPAETPASESAAQDETVSYESVGVDIPAAAEQPDTAGGILWDVYGGIGYDPNVYLMALLYFAMPKAEFEDSYQKYLDDTISDEENERMMSSYSVAGYLIASSGSFEDANASALEFEEPYTLTELGAAEGYTFWFISEPDEEYLSGLDAAYADEFVKLQNEMPELLKGSRFYAPVDPLLALSGQVVRFETTDLDGNTVTSEELFAQNEITMINYWATWCGPCKGELAELGELHTRLQEKGCGLIGIVSLVDNGDDCAEDNAAAHELLAENGVTYPNIVASDDMTFLDIISSIPTSFFVDKEGRILTDPIVGAQVAAYEPAIDKLLAGDVTAAGTTAAAGVYRIVVQDEDGKSVNGAKVQFCSDEDCRFATTDETGVVTFEADAAVYSVHILKAPEGFAGDETEYLTTETFDDLTITLHKG